MQKVKINYSDNTISYGDVTIMVAPPPVRKIRSERYESLPLYDENAAGWKSGRRLLSCQAHECSFPGALVPGSVKVKKDGMTMQAGRDVRVNEHWGTVGRLPDGDILPDEQITVSYSYYPSRIDSLVINTDGKPVLKIGKDGALIITADKVIEIAAEKNIDVKDTTGAGDFFAAGFLYGLSKNAPLEVCGRAGSICAAAIIAEWGTWLDEEKLQYLKNTIQQEVTP